MNVEDKASVKVKLGVEVTLKVMAKLFVKVTLNVMVDSKPMMKLIVKVMLMSRLSQTFRLTVMIRSS